MATFDGLDEFYLTEALFDLENNIPIEFYDQQFEDYINNTYDNFFKKTDELIKDQKFINQIENYKKNGGVL